MKALLAALRGLLHTLRGDGMLFVILPVPLLCAVALRLLVPMAEMRLTEYFHTAAVLSPYYLCFDLLAASMAPFMLAYVSVMVLLEERDEGLTRFLLVTPLGRGGYLLSRVFCPILMGTLYTVPLLLFFSLTGPGLWLILLLAPAGGLSGAIASLLVSSLAENKMEGMALLKVSTLLLLGSCVPFFVRGTARYLAAPLPSFWMAELAMTRQPWLALPLLAVAGLWLCGLWRRFEKRLV